MGTLNLKRHFQNKKKRKTTFFEKKNVRSSESNPASGTK